MLMQCRLYTTLDPPRAWLFFVFFSSININSELCNQVRSHSFHREHLEQRSLISKSKTGAPLFVCILPVWWRLADKCMQTMDRYGAGAVDRVLALHCHSIGKLQLKLQAKYSFGGISVLEGSLRFNHHSRAHTRPLMDISVSHNAPQVLLIGHPHPSEQQYVSNKRRSSTLQRSGGRPPLRLQVWRTFLHRLSLQGANVSWNALKLGASLRIQDTYNNQMALRF